ncbi:hypothetical_protein [Candidozyma auris]|uniref:translation initiation factor 3 subunit CLU1 n=1 Tax=Candidozyma auris TaxID=498019 RepID=UPI000D2E076E|nr:translation initiation factor 3 subunit CLU1 [[Candida] auris]QEO23756.1 hypothetical_protein [[Candida] auris]GBL52180.1 hypothetical protein CAJCM15448_44540 [[Candida] auris]
MAEAQSSQPEPAQVVLKIALPSFLGHKIEYVETHHVVTDTVSDVKEALTASSLLSQLTNFNLFHGEKNVTEEFDDFSTLEEVFGAPGKFDLRLTERAYSLKDVYDHLLKFRETIGMNFFDHAARAYGVSAGGVKFNSLGFKEVKKHEEKKQEEQKKEETEDSAENETSDEEKAQIKAVVSQLVEPKEFDVVDFATTDSILARWNLPIKSLTLSQWSVPQHQKAKGDLLYLTLTTLESETYSITCHASGFFVNRLSNANFDPSLKVNEKGAYHREYIFHNLVASLSPKFLATIEANKDALAKGSEYAESYLVLSQSAVSYPWLVTEAALKDSTIPDSFRSQLPVISNGVDGADFVKDWNEEYQGIKEFSKDSFNERLLREKLLNKYIQEFTQISTTTAVEILRGNIVPLNPNEPKSDHIFLRNNIFYSFGVNATGAHDETGGDEAARYCFGKDLAAVKLLNRLDVPGVSNLLTCIVDFLGERVVCQAPVPGVFSDQVDENGNSIDKIVQGYSHENNVIHTSEDFNEALKPIGEAFHLKPHTVELASGASTDKELALSKDAKCIVGTDHRKYIIDLYRTTPLDIEFLDEHYDASETSYPHKEASLRHDAVEEWYKRKAAAMFKVETERLEKEGKLKDGEEKPSIALPVDQIVLNPDAFTGVEESKDDQEDVREVSNFIKKQLIPELLDDIMKNSVPFDGAHLTAFMHRAGINMRYLGYIVKQALSRIEAFEKETEATVRDNEAAIKQKAEEEKTKSGEEKEKDEKTEKEETTEDEKKQSSAKLVPVKANMTALTELAIQEMIARGAKHVIRKLGKTVPFLLKPHFVVHFHNCLFGRKVNGSPTIEIDALLKPLFSKEETAFADMKPEDVINAIEKEVFLRFRYSLAPDWPENIKPFSLLREIAMKVGIQWKARSYHFTKEEFDANETSQEVVEQVSETKGKKKGKGKKNHQKPAEVSPPPKRTTVFIVDDIVDIVPIVKDASYRCSMVDEVYETAKSHLSKGDVEVGTTLMTELISFYQQIYGTVNTEAASLYSTLAQFYAERGMTTEASIVARKAIILNERIFGADSYETINAYIKASFFDSLNKDQSGAFALNSRALQLWTDVYGPNHPNCVSTLTNFAAILQDMKLHKEANKLFAKSLETSEKLNGEVSDITALIRHRYAVSLVQLGNYKGAQEQFAKAGEVFNKVVGPEDVFSKECSNFVTQIKTYIAYNEHQAAEQRKNQKGKIAAKSNASVASKPAQKSAGKNGKKSSPVSDPAIASKSVEEILQFIEGKSSSSEKKKNKKKN